MEMENPTPPDERHSWCTRTGMAKHDSLNSHNSLSSRNTGDLSANVAISTNIIENKKTPPDLSTLDPKFIASESRAEFRDSTLPIKKGPTLRKGTASTNSTSEYLCSKSNRDLSLNSAGKGTALTGVVGSNSLEYASLLTPPFPSPKSAAPIEKEPTSRKGTASTGVESSSLEYANSLAPPLPSPKSTATIAKLMTVLENYKNGVLPKEAPGEVVFKLKPAEYKLFRTQLASDTLLSTFFNSKVR